MDLTVIFQENWIMISAIVSVVILFFVWVFSESREVEKKKIDKGLLFCPIRGILRVRKYDANGNYSEEYQRIRLIKYLLKKGYFKNQFIIEYSIPIGHKGHNTLRVDLVIKKEDKFIIVVEVKKNYTKENKNSAIKHQLIPAMRILNSKYGVYFDGTRQSRLLTRNNDGSLSIREFP